MDNNSLITSIARAKSKYKKERETFIQQRSVQEQLFNDFIEKLLTLEGVAERLGITSNTTYKKMFPSLWMDPIPEEQYSKEYDAYKKFKTMVDDLFQKINAMAKKEYDDYVAK